MAKILTVDEYISSLSEELQPVGQQLADVISSGLPRTTGVIWHGHPVWMSGKTPVAAFKAHTSHVTFMIWRGQEITDRSGRLQPSGSATMANLKASSTDDVDADLFANWLHQVDRLERS